MTINRTLADLPTSTTYDVNGKEIILDADADTSITADTDDTIDIKIAGADDFQFAANTFNILSGSTLAVNSGATIANSGTATGFGGGSWTFISEANLSGGAAAGIDFTTGVSSTYDCYMFHLLDVAPTDDVNMIQCRVYTGSASLESSSNYSWVTIAQTLGSTGNGNYYYYRSNSVSSLMMNNANNFGNGTNEVTSGHVYMFNANAAGKTFFRWEGCHISENSDATSFQGFGSFDLTTVVTGFRVFSRDSNTESGTVRMYGLNKS